MLPFPSSTSPEDMLMSVRILRGRRGRGVAVENVTQAAATGREGAGNSGHAPDVLGQREVVASGERREKDSRLGLRLRLR